MSQMLTSKSRAYIGLGGNIGDVVEAFRQALQMLDRHAEIAVETVSPVYLTPPWGVEDQPWFHNACAALETGLVPDDLLSQFISVEKSLARVRDKRWGPRTIDLDILVYGDVQLKTDRLTIPHPRIKERQFVLQPLHDIAPDISIEGRSPKDWLTDHDWAELETVALKDDWWREQAPS